MAPTFDGGSQVLDYRIWYDKASESHFEVLVEGLIAINYINTGL